MFKNNERPIYFFYWSARQWYWSWDSVIWTTENNECSGAVPKQDCHLKRFSFVLFFFSFTCMLKWSSHLNKIRKWGIVSFLRKKTSKFMWPYGTLTNKIGNMPTYFGMGFPFLPQSLSKLDGFCCCSKRKMG